jgi:hypothetical protein
VRVRAAAGERAGGAASVYGSIFPAVWSFQLRCARGLGSALTALHLFREDETAKLLGIRRRRAGGPAARGVHQGHGFQAGLAAGAGEHHQLESLGRLTLRLSCWRAPR